MFTKTITRTNGAREWCNFISDNDGNVYKSHIAGKFVLVHFYNEMDCGKKLKTKRESS